jgi:hypothetical protein
MLCKIGYFPDTIAYRLPQVLVLYVGYIEQLSAPGAGQHYFLFHLYLLRFLIKAIKI